MLDVLIEYLIVRFKDIKSVFCMKWVLQKANWKGLEMSGILEIGSLQRKNTKYYEDKSNREGKIIRNHLIFGQ